MSHHGKDDDSIRLMAYPLAVVLTPDKVIIIEHNGEVAERALEAPDIIDIQAGAEHFLDDLQSGRVPHAESFPPGWEHRGA